MTAKPAYFEITKIGENLWASCAPDRAAFFDDIYKAGAWVTSERAKYEEARRNGLLGRFKRWLAA